MKFFARDNIIPQQLINAAIAEWPADDWDGWHVYDGGKRASRSIDQSPESIKQILRLMACEVPQFNTDTFPDVNCYAAGLHEIPAGTVLHWHRDAEKHALKPWERVQTAILYLDDGGSLRFRGLGFREEVNPYPGLLVSFDKDRSVEHSVDKSTNRRRSLAMFFYRLRPGYTGSEKADFAKPQPFCRHCGQSTEFKLITHRARFYRCDHCGCESSDMSYSDVSAIYQDGAYLTHYNLSAEDAIDAVGHNCRLIESVGATNKSILDVGCLNGSMLAYFYRDGWEVAGFDVNANVPQFLQDQYGIPKESISCGIEFKANEKQYGCVVSREVIEHVSDHKSHFAELVKATLPGGIIHVQTPRPVNDPSNDPIDTIVYQSAHLQILSADALRGLFKSHGLKVEHEQEWSNGQLVIGRKPQ